MTRNFCFGAAALVLLQFTAFMPDQHGVCVFLGLVAGFCLGKLRWTVPWIMRER